MGQIRRSSSTTPASVELLATAIIAGGEAALNRSTETWPVEVLAVLRDGSLLATPGLRA